MWIVFQGVDPQTQTAFFWFYASGIWDKQLFTFVVTQGIVEDLISFLQVFFFIRGSFPFSCWFLFSFFSLYVSVLVLSNEPKPACTVAQVCVETKQ